MIFERRLGKAARERTVFAAYGERGFPLCEPWLAGGVGQQFGRGAWSYEIVAAKAGAVVEGEVVAVEAGVEQELANDPRTLSGRAIRAVHLAEAPEQKLGMKILRDLEGKFDVVGQRGGPVRHLNRWRHRSDAQRTLFQMSWFCGQCGNGLMRFAGKALRIHAAGMLGKRFAVNFNAVVFERTLERLLGELCGIFDGYFGGIRFAHGYGTRYLEDTRADRTVDADGRGRLCCHG